MIKIDYKLLNAKQKESFNYQKVSAVLADYGYTCYRMHDDYHGADFHAVHIDGKVLKIQLKGRLHVDKKYLDKDIFIAFPNEKEGWYLYPHDDLYYHIINLSPGAKKKWREKFSSYSR